MPKPQIRAFLAWAALWFAAPCFAQEVFINEIHYDNVGGDVDEFVEVAGAAGVNLTGYTLVFYNGANGDDYKSQNLSGTLPDQAGGYGALAFFVSSIQNGAPDGVALFDGGDLVEFLSYEGAFSVAGLGNSTDIGVSEPTNSPVGESLQRTGSGAVGADFGWTGPLAASPGSLNAGQSFVAGQPAISLIVSPDGFAEDAGAGAASATLTLNPPPAAPVTVSLGVSRASEVTLPASVSVGVSGAAVFSIGAVEDGVGDGDQVVELSAVAAGYLAATTRVTVFDIDPPAGRGAAYRVATYNVQNGVGGPGDPGYEAALRVLRRIGADAVAFTEADPDNGFADLSVLLAELGLDHFAAVGDGFGAQAYSSGDFGAGQAIGFASRWPITRAVQIGRGDFSRRELTRFPLFVQVDVPGTAADPSLVAVHLKAGNTQADIFRRAVEGHRIRQFLELEGIDGANENVFLLGDVNEDFEDFFQNSVFTGVSTMTHVFGDGSTFPASYLLGSDLASPGQSLNYTDFPRFAFSSVGIGLIDSEQLDGAVRTFNVAGDARLDYVMAATSTSANALPQTEVYNSLFEFGDEGLPKLGAVPFGSDSFVGSDHHLVFGDFSLEPVSQVVLSVSPGMIDETAPPVSITGTVQLVPPLTTDAEVRLVVTSGRFDVPQSVTVPAGGVAEFPVALNKPGGAAPDGDLRITGYADDLMPGHDFVTVLGAQASGVLLISGYVEPASGVAPKALEIVNSSGVEIDFADTPLRLLVGANGAKPAPAELTLSEGTLGAGEVFVVGSVTTGNYLVDEGFLADPGVPFSNFDTGTPFLAPGGEVVFVYRPLFFNGDDALALQLSYTVSDTFGRVGVDPGSSWSGGGVSSANQNLALRDDVGTGSAGWDDPSERWVNNGSGNSLAGFGIPPLLDDPYIDWARMAGLVGAAAGTAEDLECDGTPNLVDYALGGLSPAAAIVSVGADPYLGLEFRRLTNAGRVRYTVEVSDDLEVWAPAPVVEVSAVLEGGGYERVQFRLTQPLGPVRRFLRLRVTMP